MLALATLSSCSKNESSPAEIGEGSITISTNIETKASQSDSSSGIFQIPSDLIPSEEELTLHITGEYVDIDTNSKISYDESFEGITTFNSDFSVLWCGEYQATLSDGNDPQTEGEGCVHFASATTPFTVEASKYDVAIALSVSLQNSIMRLSCDDWFFKYFSGAKLIITTGGGNKFTFDPFDESNDDRIVFVAPNTELKLSGTASRANGGSDVTFAENTITTTKAGYITSINIETTNVGALSVTVSIDDKIIKIHEDDIELNPID